VLSATNGKSDYTYTVQFTNNSSQLAFFINPQITINGEEVMPSFWSDNYFSLAAHETTSVTVSCPIAKLNGLLPDLTLEGWNVGRRSINLKK
jgi:hypothetical protein